MGEVVRFPSDYHPDAAAQHALIDLPLPISPKHPRCESCTRSATVAFSFGVRCSACARLLVDPDLGGDPCLVTDVFYGMGL